MSSYYEKILATGEVKCIDEEIPFEIPQGWEWCRLRDVIYPPKYGTSSKSLPNGDVPVLRMGNIQDGEVVYDKLVFSNNVEDNRKYLLQDGDLLFNRTNSAELVGKTAIFKGNRHVIYAGYLILLRPIKTNSEYLNYIFSSPYVRSYCKKVKTIGVQQCNINAEKVSQLLVPIAPFEEQMRIVDRIKEVLPSVDKYSISQYNLDLLNVSLSECLKKSILQEAIQGRLVPQIAEEGTAHELLEQIKAEKQKLVKEGKLKKSALATSVIFRGDDNRYYTSKNKDTICIDDEIPFEIPDSWVWVRFGTIMINRDRERIPLSVAQRQFLSKRYDYYGASGVIDKVDRYLFDKELLLIGEDGANLLSRSTPIAFIAKGKYWVNNHAHVLDVYDGVMLKYIALYINSISLAPYVTGTAQPKMNQEKMNSILIALPPQKEQQRIVAQIEKLFEHLH